MVGKGCVGLMTSETRYYITADGREYVAFIALKPREL